MSNQSHHPDSINTGNDSFVPESTLSRRSALRGLAGASLFGLVGLPALAGTAAATQISTSASDWHSAGTGSHSVSDAAAGGVELSWNNGSRFRGRWKYYTTATSSGTLEFDWNFSGCHSWYKSRANAYVFVGGPSGTNYVPLSRTGGCGFNKSGTTTISVNQGYTFGIAIDGSHYDSSRHMYGTFTLSLPVTNAAPTAAFTFSPSNPVTGSPVSFDATGSSDPDGDALTYNWDFNGEGAASGVAPDFTFATGGEKTVTLTVTDPSGASDSTSQTFSIAWALEIDVKPGNGDETDPINPSSRGNIPVAVYSTDVFDATTLDVSSLAFGPGGASADHGGHAEDVDGDGLVDLMLHFPSEDSGFTDGDTEAELVGQTTDGVDAIGSDEIRTVGGKPKKPKKPNKKGK